MREFGIKNDSKLAEYFAVDPSTVHTWRKRDKLPLRKIIAACRENKVSLELIFWGETKRSSAVNEATEIYGDDVPTRELLDSARKVLSSGNQMAAEALEKNIRYFAHAIEIENRLVRLEEEVRFIKKEMLNGHPGASTDQDEETRRPSSKNETA